METIITIGIVVLAVVAVGYGVYRTATGKSSCPGCQGCSKEDETCNRG